MIILNTFRFHNKHKICWWTINNPRKSLCYRLLAIWIQLTEISVSNKFPTFTHTTKKPKMIKIIRDCSFQFWLEWQSFTHQQRIYVQFLWWLPIEYKGPMSHTVMTEQWQVYIPMLTAELSKTLFLSPLVMFATKVSHGVSILTSWGWGK